MHLLKISLLIVIVWAGILLIPVDAEEKILNDNINSNISNEQLKRPKRGLLLAKAALLGGGAILAKKALIGKGLLLGAALYHKKGYTGGYGHGHGHGYGHSYGNGYGYGHGQSNYGQTYNYNNNNNNNNNGYTYGNGGYRGGVGFGAHIYKSVSYQPSSGWSTYNSGWH